MFFFDLERNNWVRGPGNYSPPWGQPAVMVDSRFDFSIQFCRGKNIEMIFPDSWDLTMKKKGDYFGVEIASSSDPSTDNDGTVVFSVDLTGSNATEYFTENPNADSYDAAVEIEWIDGGTTRKTLPLIITVQNTYNQSA